MAASPYSPLTSRCCDQEASAQRAHSQSPEAISHAPNSEPKTRQKMTPTAATKTHMHSTGEGMGTRAQGMPQGAGDPLRHEVGTFWLAHHAFLHPQHLGSKTGLHGRQKHQNTYVRPGVCGRGMSTCQLPGKLLEGSVG